MAPQEWTSPAAGEMTAGYAAAQPPQQQPQNPAYQMRPLSLGEVLDRTFTVYRSRFWLFAGISVLSGSVQLGMNALNLLARHLVQLKFGFKAGLIETQIGAYVALLVFYLASTETQAATVYALDEVYLGRETSVGNSIRATIGRWHRYIGIGLWQGWSASWVMLVVAVPGFALLGFGVARSGGSGAGMAVAAGFLIFIAVMGGGAYGVVAYLRNSLAVQSAVIEGLTVRSAIRRSKVLTKGTKGRIFVVLLVAACLYWVAGAIEMPMVFFIMKSPLEEHVALQAVMLLITFVAHTLVSPVALIGLSLVYFDQRVRHEGFDLLMLLGPESVPVYAAAPVAPAPVVYAEAPVLVEVPAMPVMVEVPVTAEAVVAAPEAEQASAVAEAGRVDDGAGV